MLNNWTEIYTNRFIIISNKTGPVTLTCVLSYQENIKHKSGINLTVSVLNRQRVFKHTAKYRTLQPFVMIDGRTGRSLKKTPLNFSSQQISMTMKTSDKFTKVIINYWGWSFLLKKKNSLVAEEIIFCLGLCSLPRIISESSKMTHFSIKMMNELNEVCNKYCRFVNRFLLSREWRPYFIW